MKYSQELELAIEAALKAGAVIMEIYKRGKVKIEIKEDNSPLTEADKQAHKAIERVLSSYGLPILSEEGAHLSYERRRKWDKFWMIDPIDGTKEFIKRNGQFTVNIALICDQKPILGVVYAPHLKDLYIAQNSLGSFKIPNVTSITDIQPLEMINLSKSRYPKNYTIVVSRSHMNKETESYIESMNEKYGDITITSFGSSLKICKVAEGSAHCYPRFGPTMEWDIAAAHAIAVYANCTIKTSDMQEDLVYNKKNLLNPYFLVEKN